MKKWLENYWYHYKWHTIAAVFVLFVVVDCVIQSRQTETFDMQCSVVTVSSWSDEDNAALAERLSELFSCKVGINFYRYDGDINSAVDPNVFAAYSVRLFADLSEQVSALYFTDTPSLLLELDPSLRSAGSTEQSVLDFPDGFEILYRDDTVLQKVLKK